MWEFNNSNKSSGVNREMKKSKRNKNTIVIKVEDGLVELELSELIEKTQEEKVSTKSIFEDVATRLGIGKVNQRTQVSVYLDQDVQKAYNDFGARYGKGGKSDLVNQLLRNALIK